MSDNTPSPADKAQLDKITNVHTALVDETRQSKVMISYVIAQRSEYAADIKDLKASIDTTRCALDPEQLGIHVADNIDELMGQSVQAFAKGIRLNLEAAKANQTAANHADQAAQNIEDQADKLNMERNALAAIARHLEERDQRPKWDWVTLGCAMLIAAGLAGGGAYYYAQAAIKKQDFNRSVQLISQDDDAGWCNVAQAPIIQDRNGLSYCAISMPEYQVPEAE